MLKWEKPLCDEETRLRASIATQPSYPPLPCSPPPALVPELVSLHSRSEKDLEELCFRFSPSMEEPSQVVVRSATVGCDLNQSSSSNTASIENCSRSIKYERKSPNRTVVQDEEAELPEENKFDLLPWHIMYKIFDTFELKQRVCASMVCKRWQSLLTDGRFPLEDVAVLNIFQQNVWDSLQNKTGSKVDCVKLDDYQQFEKLLPHCSVSSSVKIWYISMDFVRSTLEKLQGANVKMRSLDVYPYSDQVGMQYFKQFLPNITGMTMRPHAKEFFFGGLQLDSFPDFPQLDSLHLDSFNLGDDVELPKSLTTLEWQNRNVEEFRRFLPKLESMTELEYLLLGHAEFSSDDFAQFIDLIQIKKMSSLRYLLFKFSKLENLDVSCIDYRDYPKPLAKLQFLKFDLCYGDLGYIVNRFLAITGPALKIISLNIISDETSTKSAERVVFKDLFGWVAEKLENRNVYLHLGLLQRDSLPKLLPSSYPKVAKSFEKVLSKFEASFVTDALLIRSIFQMQYSRLTEIKFIQCNAVNNDTLCMISTNCLQLRRLSVLHCKDCCEIGIRHFVEQFHLRHSPVLKIVWKRDQTYDPRPANFYLNLINEYSFLITGIKARFFCKVFNETKNGETVLIWSNTKRLYIQDYDEMDRNRVLGIVLPDPVEMLPIVHTMKPRLSYIATDL